MRASTAFWSRSPRIAITSCRAACRSLCAFINAVRRFRSSPETAGLCDRAGVLTAGSVLRCLFGVGSILIAVDGVLHLTASADASGVGEAARPSAML